LPPDEKFEKNVDGNRVKKAFLAMSPCLLKLLLFITTAFFKSKLREMRITMKFPPPHFHVAIFCISGPLPGFTIWGKTHFWDGKIVFIICLKQIYLGATQLRGRKNWGALSLMLSALRACCNCLAFKNSLHANTNENILFCSN